MDLRVAAVLSLIHKQPGIDIQALSTSVNVSPSRLRHLFRLEMAIPLGKYLREYRLDRARGLLETTFLSVKQVSQACGFNDAKHFTRQFRKSFCVSPAGYRRAATFDTK